MPDFAVNSSAESFDLVFRLLLFDLGGLPEHGGETAMASSWAYIYEHPGTDPVVDRRVIDRDGQRTALVPVPEASDAPAVARELVASGVELIELCGGFDVGTVARVVDAVDGTVPVGHVSFGFESITGAAAYKERWEQAAAEPRSR